MNGTICLLVAEMRHGFRYHYKMQVIQNQITTYSKNCLEASMKRFKKLKKGN